MVNLYCAAKTGTVVRFDWLQVDTTLVRKYILLAESLVDVCRLLAAERQELQTPVRPPDTIHQEQDLCDV